MLGPFPRLGDAERVGLSGWEHGMVPPPLPVGHGGTPEQIPLPEVGAPLQFHFVPLHPRTKRMKTCLQGWDEDPP